MLDFIQRGAAASAPSASRAVNTPKPRPALFLSASRSTHKSRHARRADIRCACARSHTDKPVRLRAQGSASDSSRALASELATTALDDDDDESTMVVECPHCMKQLKIEAEGYDTFLCPGCRREFRVPAEDE